MPFYQALTQFKQLGLFLNWLREHGAATEVSIGVLAAQAIAYHAMCLAIDHEHCTPAKDRSAA